MLTPTILEVTGERFVAVYRLSGSPAEARERAAAICIEQTIEFPPDLVPDDDIRRHIFGRIEDLIQVGPQTVDARISYALETAGLELPQLLNVLFGNSSLLPGIRLIDVEFPHALPELLPGPQFGVDRLRGLFDAPHRPLLATALKPMGLSARALSEMAGQLARGGIDIIKDDHGLANQPFASYTDRVRSCATAIGQANEETGNRAVYMPSLNARFDLLEERAEVAIEAGAGALLLLPGITGFDHLRHVAETAGLPIMAHPAFLGSYVTPTTEGIDHGLLLGLMMRLVGADICIFPHFGGRFAFSPETCAWIARRCREPIDGIRPAWPGVAGGMTLGDVPRMVTFYGSDVVLLIGGNLHRGGNLAASAQEFRRLAESYA
jgi:ribulose-bisphosphate carboxylase large chain